MCGLSFLPPYTIFFFFTLFTSLWYPAPGNILDFIHYWVKRLIIGYFHYSTKPIPWQMPYMVIFKKLWFVITTFFPRAFLKNCNRREIFVSLTSYFFSPNPWWKWSLCAKLYWWYPMKGIKHWQMTFCLTDAPF